MKDNITLKIGSETYGLFLITSNVSEFFLEKNYNNDNKRIIDDLINKLNIGEIEERELNEEGPKVEINCVNIWPLLGIHDLAILIKSNSKLDPAIIRIGENLEIIKNKKINPPSWINDYPNIRNIFESWAQMEKKIDIFDYWCEPLIPLYVNEKIRSNKNCMLIYFRLNTNNFNYSNLLSELLDKCEDSCKDDILAIFNGFGIFDLIIFVELDSYLKIQNKINEIRSCFGKSVHESCSLITSPSNIEKEHDISFSVLIKTNLHNNSQKILKDIEIIAQEIGIRRICIEEVDASISLTYKQGFFEIVFIGHGNINNFSDFRTLLDSMPFIVDTASMINLSINCKNGE